MKVNQDKSIPCRDRGRYPELWEEAFPYGVCYECGYDLETLDDEE